MTSVFHWKLRAARNASLFFAVLMIGSSLMLAQTSAQQVLTNDDVIRMVSVHMADSKIIQMIQSQPGDYTLMPDYLDRLREHGVSDVVIAAMTAKASSSFSGTASVNAASAQQPGLQSSPKPEVEPKKAGVIRVGVVLPAAQLGSAQGTGTGESVRSILVKDLTSPSVEAVSIVATEPQAIEAEAQAKQCDYLVYSAITENQKKSGSGLASLRAASRLAAFIPGIGAVASAAGAIATAATAAQDAVALSSGVTAKSQISLRYYASVPGASTSILSDTLSAKATTDGEDVVTPLIQQEAAAITSGLMKQQK
jgi:hypothetical protein